MSDTNKYIPKCCDTCTHYVYGCNDLDCLLYSHYELDGCVASEYEKAINQAIADDRRKFAEWCKIKGYGCYDWGMLIKQYEMESRNEQNNNV